MSQTYTDEDYIVEVDPNTRGITCPKQVIHEDSKRYKFLGWTYSDLESDTNVVEAVDVEDHDITVYARFAEKTCGLGISWQLVEGDGNQVLEVEFENKKPGGTFEVYFIVGGTYDRDNSVINMNGPVGTMSLVGMDENFYIRVHFNNPLDLYCAKNEFYIYRNGEWDDDVNRLTKVYNLCITNRNDE